jgi:hypothetical protein
VVDGWIQDCPEHRITRFRVETGKEMSFCRHTYECVKKDKRLWIMEVETQETVYTPPSWIQMPSREPMKALAAHFTDVGYRDIQAIIDFEVKYGTKKKARVRA